MTAPVVFISYRNRPLSREVGGTLFRYLQDNGVNAFFDQTRLKNEGGISWEDTLYEAVAGCLVLLVLVEERTAESAWVKKEIDTARDHHCAVVPIVVEDDTSLVNEALTTLDIDGLQYLPYQTKPTEVILQTIHNRSEEVARERNRRRLWHEKGIQHFRLPSADHVRVSLVAGDATEVEDYHVLVNTENTFMQMARYFEVDTLSSTIRRKGSLFEDDYLIEDTVQEQLNHQVKHGTRFGIRPVRLGYVLVTEAGHPHSELVQRGFRYLFHAAAVLVDKHERRIDPIPLGGIDDIVVNCMDKIAEIYDKQGSVVCSATGDKLPALPDYAVTSILFPLFGAGEGGHAEIEVAEVMVETFKQYIQTHPADETPIEHIGLCVYDANDAEPIAASFRNAGFEQVID